MNYDELISLERKAVFGHCSANEWITDFFLRIWRWVVRWPRKIDSWEVQFTICQNVKKESFW